MDDRGQCPIEGNVEFDGLVDLGDGNTSGVLQGSILTHPLPPPSATQTIRPENVVLGGSSVPQPPSATQTVRPGNVVLGGSSVPQPPSAAQTVQRGRRPQTRMSINVATNGRRRPYRFLVDPNGKVSGLRALLVNRADDLPLDYGFIFNRVLLNEDRSFQSQVTVVGSKVPKIDVVGMGANFQPGNV